MTEPDLRARFEALLRAHGDAVFAAVRRFAADPAEAEDLWQETAWAAWNAFPTLDDARDPRPWLRTLAVNKAIDRLRRAAARPTLGDDEGLAERRAPASTPPIDFEDELTLLPPLQRAATLLRFQEGRSVTEIASLLGAPEGTVKTWLSRARERLRRRFVDESRPSRDGARR
jgi:RNA polymerase sigma factor (sigma-70 family)